MYETKNHQPLTRRQFFMRMVNHLAAALALMIASIIFGMLGYMLSEHLSWTDAFLNTTMLLGGMGPVNIPITEGGKLFAGFYALYSGLFFIVSAAIILTPVMHRVLHRFHWD